MQLSHAYGPGDITCVAVVPGAALVVDEVTDASYSEHVDKIPIRRLGHRAVVGFATGSGTFAGTIVCAQLTKGAFWKVRNYFGAVRVFGEEVLARQARTKLVEPGAQFFASAVSVTQLPPIHLMWVHTSEAGQMSIQRWYNVVFSDKGGVFGASNGFTEQTLQYQCSYQEEIRLHRSLTVHEMQRLRERMTTAGFFTDYHGREPLVESLSAVSKELAREYAFDDLAGYLGAETAGYARAVRDGEATSLGVFDTGAVVFQGAGTPAPAAALAESVAAAGGEAPDPGEVVGPDFELRAGLEEDVPVSATGSAVTFAKARGTLEVALGRAYVVPAGAPRSEAHDVGPAAPGSVTLPGADYLARLGTAPAGGIATPTVPRTVTLSFGPAGARRTAAAGPEAALRVTNPGGAVDVFVTAAWSGSPWSDVHRITGRAGDYRLSGAVGPATYGPVSGVAAGANTWRFPTEFGEVTAVLAESEVRVSRQGGGPPVWSASERVALTAGPGGTLLGSFASDGFRVAATYDLDRRTAAVEVTFPDGRRATARATNAAPGLPIPLEVPGAHIEVDYPVNATARPLLLVGVENKSCAGRGPAPSGEPEVLSGPGVELSVADGRASGPVLGTTVSVPLGTETTFPGTALRVVASRTGVRFERPDKTL